MAEMNKPAEGQSPDPIKVNHIIFVLDKSGSMGHLRESTVRNFNEQLQQLKSDVKTDQANLISLVTFAGAKYIRDVKESVPLSQFDELKLEDYIPNGATAMYDAIGHAVMKADLGIEKYSNFDNAALIVILSDGEENCSIEYNRNRIADIIKERQDGGKFTFTFMGCGEVVRGQAGSINIPFGNTVVWDYSDLGMKGVMSANLCSTQSFVNARSAGHVATSGFYDQPYQENFQENA